MMKDIDDNTSGRMTHDNERRKAWSSDDFSVSYGKRIETFGPAEFHETFTRDEIAIVTVPQRVIGCFGDDPKRAVEMLPNRFHFIQENTLSKGVYEDSCRPVVFQFPKALRSKFLDYHPAKHALDEPRAARQLLKNAQSHVALAKDFLDSGGYGGTLRAESLMMLVISDAVASLADDVQNEHINTLSHAQIATLTEYIDSHLDSRLCLESLASLVNISPFHFSRLFKATTQLSPHRYVVKHRLEKAKILLGTTHDSIAQIALDVGFASQSHMTTAFKKEVGATPNRYRTEVR